MKISIGQILTYRTSYTPNLEAIVDSKTRYTYVELNQRVNQLVKWLQSENIGQGDRIAIYSRNCAELLMVYFASAKFGAILVPLNARLHPAELQYVLESSEAKLLFYENVFINNMSRLRTVPFLQQCVQIGTSSKNNDLLFSSILTGDSEEPIVTSGGDDPLLLVYTSGTTGRPKGVIISHKNLFFNLTAGVITSDLRERDRYLAVTPLFHISGLLLTVVCVYQGLTVVCMQEFHPVAVWDVIENEKINAMMSIPPMLILMFQSSVWKEKKFDSLRIVFCGGMFVPPELIELFNSLGISIGNVYGCTEVAGGISFLNYSMGMDKSHTVGKPIPFSEVKIFDPIRGDEVEQGKIGEIAIKAEFVFPGYWKNEEETKKVLRDGWFYTGDLGKFDEDGFLILVDRLKDLIVCNGENIYPAEVEAILQNIEGVAEAAVIGIAHSLYGKIPVAYVVRKPGYNLTELDILEHCYDRLAAFKCGKDVRFVDSLPRNAFGKIMKEELRKQAIAEQQNNDIK